LVFFVLANIFIKINGRARVPSSVINLATYSVAVWAFLIAGNGKVFNITSFFAVLLILFAAVCVYVGNAASVRGFNRAPNSGYSQAIVKSYVVITVLASIFLFGGEFLWQKIFGVALVLTGQFLIVTGEVGKKAANEPRWIHFSFIAFFSYGLLAIAVKYAAVNLGINQSVFLFWAVLIAVFFFAIEIFYKKISIINYGKQAKFLLLTGFCSGIANVFMWDAFVRAPNMGYVNAINAGAVAVISLVSAKFFGDELSRRKSLGIAGVILGLVLIVLN